MADLIRFSDAASLAFHATSVIAGSSGRGPCSAPDLARRLGVSRHHLVKVMQRLARSGLVRPVRGSAGGFRLARDPRAVTLLDVLEAIDGPFRATACQLKRRSCRGLCLFGGALASLKLRLRDHLSATTLAEASARIDLPPSRGEAP